MATIILFPNMRAPIVEIVRQWNERGYWLTNNKRGRLVLVRATRSN